MKKIIIHCSASSFGNAVMIDSWHRARGFDNIGYHFVILNGKPYNNAIFLKPFDGMAETGRNLFLDGAHCKGHNNSIGICLIGRSGDFTTNQILALKNLIYDLKNQFKKIEVYQHSDFDDKKYFCAGLSEDLIKEIKEFANG